MDSLQNSTLTGFPTHNRFDQLSERDGNSDRMRSEIQTSRQDFISSPMEGKMLHLFDELRYIRNEQVHNSLAITNFQANLNSMNEKVNQVITNSNAQNRLLNAITYKSIDMEARSRRSNLIFRGMMEHPGENCYQLIRDFMQNRLNVDPRQVYINRAHRLGKATPNRQFQKRPIIVNFRDYPDTEHIMQKTSLLKNTTFSVDYDFPREIQEARSRLWPRYKEAKRNFPNDRVQIVYPAKLLRNGRVICDELPEWNQYVNGNRLRMLDEMCEVKQTRLSRQDHWTQGPDGIVQKYRNEREQTCTPSDDVTSRSDGASGHTIARASEQIDNTTESITLASKHQVPMETQSTNNDARDDDTITSRQPRQNGANCSESGAFVAQALSNVFSKVKLPTEETSVKTLQCDNTNPLLNREIEDPPSRSRSLRREDKAKKRSASAVPYRRDSVSKTREDKGRVFPAPKNKQLIVNTNTGDPNTTRDNPNSANIDLASVHVPTCASADSHGVV